MVLEQVFQSLVSKKRIKDLSAGILMFSADSSVKSRPGRSMPKSFRVKLANSSAVHHEGEVQSVIDEVKEIIELPEFEYRNFRIPQDLDSIVFPPEVASQLRDYVVTIVTKYHNHSFHNFEHASSHVGMSVAKLISRIVTPGRSSSHA
jgi:hypothetical protein